MKGREIYCCGCQEKVMARLTDGKEIYPNRSLGKIPFWKCDKCGNYVGCHHKTRQRTKPLGFIPTPELRNARRYIHLVLDPLWKSGKHDRKELYSKITKRFGWTYHTAKIKDIKEAREIYRFIESIK